MANNDNWDVSIDPHIQIIAGVADYVETSPTCWSWIIDQGSGYEDQKYTVVLSKADYTACLPHGRVVWWYKDVFRTHPIYGAIGVRFRDQTPSGQLGVYNGSGYSITLGYTHDPGYFSYMWELRCDDVVISTSLCSYAQPPFNGTWTWLRCTWYTVQSKLSIRLERHYGGGWDTALYYLDSVDKYHTSSINRAGFQATLASIWPYAPEERWRTEDIKLYAKR